MSAGLSPRRLEWLLRARGTDMAAWPVADRVAALDLLRRSSEAQEAYAEALAREDEADDDRVAFNRMQQAVRRRLAPLSARVRGLGIGFLVVCVAAGLLLAVVEPGELDTVGDLFNTAQTLSIAALD